MIKLFLDDVRNPKDCVGYMYKRIGALNPIYLEEWHVVRNYHQFCQAIDQYKGQISYISFDHDLADAHMHESMYDDGKVYLKYIETTSEKTGYECAKYFKNTYEDDHIDKWPVMFVHSMNPIGMKRIIELFEPK